MKQTKTNRLGKILRTTALASVLLAPQAHAEPVSADARIRFQFDGNADNNVMRTTLGIAPEESYGDLPISTKGQFFETFRAYNVSSTNQGNTLNYTALGARLPDVPLFGTNTKVVIFGSFGDRNGIGIETRHSLDNFLVTLNAEQNDQDQTRLGGSLTYKIKDGLSVTGAYDQIDQPAGITRQYLGNIIADLSATDTIGAAGIVKSNADETTDYGVGAFWVHYGKEEDWGVRARARLDWNPDHDVRSIDGEVIFAEKPTTFRPGATWMVGRSAGDDEMYNLSVIPLSVSRTEPVLLQNRAREGFSLALRGSHLQAGDNDITSIGGGIGYTFPQKMLGGKLGLSTDVNYSISESAENGSIRPTLFYKNGALELEGGPIIPLGDNDNGIGAYIGLQVRF